MKWLKRIIVVVVALVVVVLAIVYFSLNSIIRTQVQTQATASLDSPTTLGSAHLAIFGGSLSLNDLEIDSPPKFSAPKIFTLNGATVSVSYGQLTDQPIHIRQIIIDSPKIIVEQSGGKLNITALMDQIPQTPKTSSGTAKEPTKLIIDDLQINNAVVDFQPGLPGLSTDIPVPIPSLDIKNIGNADGSQNGAAIKDVVAQVITALTGKAGSEGKLPLDLNKFLGTNLNQISQQLGSQFNSQFQSVAGNLTKNLPPGAANLLNGAATQHSDDVQKGLNDLNNLLGKKKN